MNKHSVILWVLMLLMTGCIGTDVIDPVQESNMSLSISKTALLTQDTTRIAVRYINEYGYEETVLPQFINLTPMVISIDESGVIIGLSMGIGKIVGSYREILSDTLSITIGESADDLAQIEIITSKQAIETKETLQLSARAYAFSGAEIEGLNYSWSSDNPQVASVTASGLVTGVSDGMTFIKAASNGVEGSIALSVGASQRMGTFMGVNGYTAKGTAVLFLDADNDLILEFSSDFEVSFALGTFIYLANSTSGSAVKAEGLELQEVTTNGSKTFNITQLVGNENVALDEYQYVIALCKPAGITFGIADLGQ